PQNRYAYHELPFEGGGYVTEELIPEWGIGIGDELLIGGLFTEMHGVECNTPIVRSGIIAAMPQKEPLFDFESREWYRGYLAEMRSLGGLGLLPNFPPIISRVRRFFRPPGAVAFPVL